MKGENRALVEWCVPLKELCVAHSRNQFDIGDLLIHGLDVREFVEKEMYRAAFEATGLPKWQLRDYAYVSRNVPPSLRNDKLLWSHHRAVAKLEQDEQRDFLGQAAVGALSFRELSEKIKLKHPVPKPENDEDENGETITAFLLPMQTNLYDILIKLAGARRCLAATLAEGILAQYLNTPAIEKEMEDADMTNKLKSEEARRENREAKERRLKKSIDDALLTYHDGGGTEVSEFVRNWENKEGETFPFAFAMNNTEFATHFAGLTEEDAQCGQFTPCDAQFQGYDRTI